MGGANPPLILCETRATAGVLRSVVSGYVCPIAGTAGQVGGFLHTEVVPLLKRRPRAACSTSATSTRLGADIEANTRRVLERALVDVLDWRRIALTQEQVARLKIEPIWKVDGRDRQGRYAYEAEALGQAGLIKLVRATLDSLLPQPLQRVQERETAQREQLRALLDGWRNGGGDGARWRERAQRGRRHST